MHRQVARHIALDSKYFAVRAGLDQIRLDCLRPWRIPLHAIPYH